jgi:hypothetical protein
VKRFVPSKPAPAPKKMDARERAQAKAADEKRTSRAGNEKPAHRVYPHLD